MATRTQTIDDLAHCEKLTCCLVCMDTLNLARTLLCGHTFCYQCILDFNCIYRQSQPPPYPALPPPAPEKSSLTNGHVREEEDECHSLEEESDDEFQPVKDRVVCPTCRADTEIQDKGPENKALSRMNSRNRSRKVSVTTMGAPVQFCDACESRSSNAEAEYYCGKCSLDLCTQCRQAHDRHELFQSHNVIHILNKDSMNLRCARPAHHKVPCLYFCATCEVPVCCICLITAHESHNTKKL